MSSRDAAELAIQHFLEGHRPPAGVGREVARRTFARRYGSTLTSIRPDLKAVGAAPMAWIVAAALGGALFGAVALSARSDTMDKVVMFSLTSGGAGGAGELLLADLVLPSAGVLRIIVLMFVLGIVTGSRVWRHVYPDGSPAGLNAARVLTLLAILVGTARVLIGCFLAYALLHSNFIAGGGSMASATKLIAAAIALEQAWWLIFWLALLSLLTVAVGLLTQRYLEPPLAGRP
jgi:hypothetical protein